VSKSLKKHANIFVYFGLVLILFSVFSFTEVTTFPGLSALLPTLGTAFIIAFGYQQKNIVTATLESRFFLWVGKISYSLYLLHWPILVLVQYYLMRPLSPIEKVVCLIITTLMAILMNKYIEQPVRLSHPGVKNKNLIITATLFIISTSVLALFIHQEGFPQRFTALNIAKSSTIEMHKDFKQCFVMLSKGEQKNYKLEKCNINKGHGKKVLLLGDSYADHYASALAQQLNNKKYALYQLTAGSCPILDGFNVQMHGCGDFTENSHSAIEAFKPDVIIMSGNWWSYSRDATLLSAIQKNIIKFKSNGSQVIFMGITPVYPSKVPYIALRQTISNPNGELKYFNQFDELLDLNFNKAVLDTKAEYYSGFNLLCDHSLCRYGNNESLFHVDHGHLSPYGANMLIREMIKSSKILKE
jgi:hypothetical protein